MSEAPLRDRDAAGDVRSLRLVLHSGLIGLVMGAAVARLTGGSWLIGALVGAAGMPLVTMLIYRTMTGAASGVITAATMPGYRGNEAAGYSHIEALEAKGDIAGALGAWEEVIRGAPNAIAARMQAADLYARKGNNTQRAAELFRAIQSHRNAPGEVQRYASQRLIDLYLGPLNDEARALVELRKIAERWPGTREAEGAKRAIADIKGQNMR